MRNSNEPVSIDKVEELTSRIAQLISDGQIWLVPLFERFENELETLKERNATLARIASYARTSKLGGGS